MGSYVLLIDHGRGALIRVKAIKRNTNFGPSLHFVIVLMIVHIDDYKKGQSVMEKSIKRQLIIFAVASVILSVLSEVLKIYISSVSLGPILTLSVPMLAAALAGEDFLRKHQRMVTRDEHKRLVRSSFIIVLIMAFINATILFAVTPQLRDVFTSGMGISIVTATIIILLGLIYVALILGYGFFTRKTALKKGYIVKGEKWSESGDVNPSSTFS